MKRQIILAIGVFSISTAAFAADEVHKKDEKGILNLVFENDYFANSDRDYTNGIRLGWASAEDAMPEWAHAIADSLPFPQNGRQRIAVTVGQSMFAPQNLSRRDLAAGDHPYAGWLYGSFGIMTDTDKTLDSLTLTLGVVGPMSLAEDAQKFVHTITNGKQPNGWDHQLKNEAGFILSYERKWRAIAEFSPFGIGADLIPHMGINLGTINTDVSTGATFRFGYDLPADYGPPRIRPSLPGSDFFRPTQELNGYLFVTVAGRAVLRNIFLDGNTFASSPNVDKKVLVGSLQIGEAITYRETRLSYTHVFMTKEYTTQKHPSAFGVIILSHRF